MGLNRKKLDYFFSIQNNFSHKKIKNCLIQFLNCSIEKIKTNHIEIFLFVVSKQLDSYVIVSNSGEIWSLNV